MKLPEVDTTLAMADGAQPCLKPRVKNRAIVPRLATIPAQPTTPYLSIRPFSRHCLSTQETMPFLGRLHTSPLRPSVISGFGQVGLKRATSCTTFLLSRL